MQVERPQPVEMSPDEIFVTALSSVVWLVTWFAWYSALFAGPKLPPIHLARRLLAIVPIVAITLIFAVLLRWASFDVRTSAKYLFQYVALGGAWTGVAVLCVSWLGLSTRDDVGERRNPCAAIAIAGAFLGIALCYIGGNIGDGPSWLVVVFASGLATASFFALWASLEFAARVSDTLTIDRDLAAGVRHAGFCIAIGLILGRAAAGDWVSASATLRDFAVNGWPALALLPMAAAMESTLKPNKESPQRSVLLHGVVPAAIEVSAAIAWLVALGEAP